MRNRGAGFLATAVAVVAMLITAAGASAEPQGPWVLPAGDVSAPGQNAFEPQLAASPDGTVTAVWQRTNGTNSIIQAATRLPGGSFGTPVDLSAPLEDAFNPQLTASPDGTLTAVWQRSNGTHDIIQAATRPPGGSFGVPVDLSAPLQDAERAQLTASPDGTLTAVWQRSNGTHDIIQAATRPPGGSFGAPVDLSAPLQSAVNQQLTASPDGTVTAVWQRSNGTHTIIQAATRPPGGSFGAPIDLSAPLQGAFTPQLTASPDGTVTAIWRRNNGANFIIQAATRPPGGSFGTPVDLSAPLQDASSPQLTASPDGTVTAVWYRSDGTDFVIQAATRPPGGSFGAPVDLTAPLQFAETPQITASPDGTVTAVWQGSDGASFPIQAATRPPEGSFSAPVNLSTTPQNGFKPVLTVSADGTATAAWEGSNGANIVIKSASTTQPSRLLQVAKAGTGTGTVSSTPAGIDCGLDCAQIYPSFTAVNLTATPLAGSTFTGWSGAGCTGTGTCEVTLLSDETATANFEANPVLVAKISKVTINGPARVKRGKRVTYNVVISNFGDARATGVRINVKGRGIRLNARVGTINAGAARGVKLRLRPSKTGRIKATFKVTSSNAGSKTVSKTITVRK